MANIDPVFIYLFLVRIVTTLLIGKLYISNRTKPTLALVIASFIYALAAILRTSTDYSPYIGTISGVFAIIGLSFILAFVLNSVYSISFKN